MPIELRYTEDGKGVELALSGTVFGEEIIQTLKELQDKESFRHLKYKLVNRLACKKYFVSAKDIRVVAEYDKAAAELNPHLVIAIVSPGNKVLQESAEIWHSFVKEAIPRSRLFDQLSSARAWVEEQLREEVVEE